MFPFIEHVQHHHYHGSHALLPWEDKPTLRRSLPQRLRLTLPAPGAPLVTTVRRPPPEPIGRAGGTWGWLVRLTGRPALRRAV